MKTTDFNLIRRCSFGILFVIVLLSCSRTENEQQRTPVQRLALTTQNDAEAALDTGIESSAQTASNDCVGCAIGIGDCPEGYNIIQGTSEDDLLEGTSGSDCILGFEGNDIIHGSSGDDFIAGGPGDDQIVSENGKDTIYGGDGDDTIVAGNGTDSIIYGGDGNDWIEASNGVDTFIYGENGDDVIIGGNGKDTIYGGDGNDLISGGNGKDNLFGNECHDVVIGGLAPDTVDGGEGYDACDGVNCERPETEVDDCSSDYECPEGYWCVASVGLCVFTEVAPNVDITCDNIDDDCNGEVDEDYPQDPTTCGIGACAATGNMICVDAEEINTCVPGDPAPDDATCNAIDDDCDGETDEDYPQDSTTCGIGACAATGKMICVSG
ncbi:MAG: hypothetical protein JXA30_22265, partial [Deltaproteobacteria bacterium]|nr:hypothetical protein [Deltaproteobacteria bacterium]